MIHRSSFVLCDATSFAENTFDMAEGWMEGMYEEQKGLEMASSDKVYTIEIGARRGKQE